MRRHGRDCPHACSQCLGAEPHVVSPDGQYVDGVHVPRDIPVESDHGKVPRRRNRGRK